MNELALKCAIMGGQDDTEASADAFEALMHELSTSQEPGKPYLLALEKAFGKSLVQGITSEPRAPRLTPALEFAMRMALLQD